MKRALPIVIGVFLGLILSALGLILSTLLLGVVAATTAEAQQPRLQCNTFTEVVRQLKEVYNEEVAATGTTHNGGTMTVFVSPGGATYSVTITAPTPSMTTCLVSAGENWRQGMVKPAGEES